MKQNQRNEEGKGQEVKPLKVFLHMAVIIAVMFGVHQTINYFTGDKQRQEDLEYVESARITLIKSTRYLKTMVDYEGVDKSSLQSLREINATLEELDESGLEPSVKENMEKLVKNPKDPVLKQTVMKDLEEIEQYLLANQPR